ncbi:exonuclease domain-containing protein [Flavobacterium celericrescens]|jgi:DNA polymerase-3 subunit epsilon|uniref:3'-5' exonuclease n=1 Tax=Flavobacterium celericrescens TaxID=2709780 RepID=A0ABX0IDT7_9FLAO|nr:exonuclease domain-containing protein [Flavobacterium celericrescens]NHM05227.1 3'-5' exonuclease [Flavobacterium celericrescens]
MLQWLNNKYPEFWKKYISSFKEKSDRYVVLSIESTGLNTSKDVILAISAVTIMNNRMIVKDALELYISHTKSEIEINQNEFLLVSKVAKKAESEAIELLINFIGNATIIGHRVYQDIELLNASLSKLGCGKLKNEALDIEIMFNKVKDTIDKKYALEEMSTYFSVPVNDRISVADDTFSIAILFLKLKTILKIK